MLKYGEYIFNFGIYCLQIRCMGDILIMGKKNDEKLLNWYTVSFARGRFTNHMRHTITKRLASVQDAEERAILPRLLMRMPHLCVR